MRRFTWKIPFFLISLFLGFSLQLDAKDKNENSGEPYNPQPTIMHHIGNSNEFHIVGDISLPLPCILYSKDDGLAMFLSSKFHHGETAYKGYVLDHGVVRRVCWRLSQRSGKGGYRRDMSGESEVGV